MGKLVTSGWAFESEHQSLPAMIEFSSVNGFLLKSLTMVDLEYQLVFEDRTGFHDGSLLATYKHSREELKRIGV